MWRRLRCGETMEMRPPSGGLIFDLYTISSYGLLWNFTYGKNDSRHLSTFPLSRRKNVAGDWRNDVVRWGAVTRCGSGVEGKRPFLEAGGQRGVRAMGEAKESDRAFSGEISAGEGLVGPTFDDDVSVRLRYHGFSESRWWDTVKENREEEHDPIFAVDFTVDGSNRRDDARGYAEKSLKSSDSSKSNDDTTVVHADSSTKGRTPCNT